MLTALSAFGLAIATTLLILLMARRPVLAGDAWLYVWIGANIVLFTGMMAAMNGAGATAFAGSFLAQLAVSAMGPALYLFAWSLTHGRAPINRLLLAALPVAGTLAFIATLTVIPSEIIEGRLIIPDAPLWTGLLPLGSILGNAAFPLAALRRLSKHRRGLGRAPAQAIQSDISWVRIWAIAHLVLLGVLMAAFLLTFAHGLSAMFQLSLIFAAQSGLIGYVGIRGITRSHVFFTSSQPVWQATRFGPARREAQADFQTIKARLADTAVHTDAGLTPSRFAGQLGWSPDRINAAIRAGGATSFASLLAQARIATVKQWALSPDHARIALLTLAMDAGFGSKSAFYDAFKAVEGVSPGSWRRAVSSKPPNTRL